jgi:DNA polymerase/3'-5' exonuclease PolX
MFEITQTLRLVQAPGEEDSMEPVSNQQIAEVLFNIATLLDMQQGNPYRIEAYRNAARGMLALPVQVTDILAQGTRLEAPGLGDRLRRKITELATTGHMTFYDDLCEESLPEDVRDLMRVPHVGPRTAIRLSSQLDIHSVEELARAAEHQQLRPYYGFGERSEHRLAQGARDVLAHPHDDGHNDHNGHDGHDGHDGGQAAA